MDNVLDLNYTEVVEVVEDEEGADFDVPVQSNNNASDKLRIKKEDAIINHGSSNFTDNKHYAPESHIPFNIPLKGKRTAQIIVPPDVKSTDFDFIINFINLMKQQYE